MNKKCEQTNRKLYFDIIRIVALLSIVMTHISANIVIGFPDSTKTEFIVGNIFNGLSRVGVPLFVMLSGALLLNEDRPFSVKRFYRKSLLWMALLLIGWLAVYGAFYAFLMPMLVGGQPSWQAFSDYVFTFKGTNYPHLWYMFMIVGAYLFIPILRLFVKRENRKYIFWMIVGSAVIQFTAKTADVLLSNTAVISVSGFLGKFHLEFLTGYIGYFLLGWYLSEYEIKKSHRSILYAVTAVTIAFSIFATQHWIAVIPTIRGNLYHELTLPPFIFGTAVFVLIKALCNGRITDSNLIIRLSTNSFGVYMIHVLYLELFTQVWFPYDGASIGVSAYILLSYLAVLSLSFITVWIIGKIPHIKKIFYLK